MKHLLTLILLLKISGSLACYRTLIASDSQRILRDVQSDITAIQEDITRPGTLLAIVGYALVEVSAGLRSITVLAGSVNETGNINGQSNSSRFGRMYSFLQSKENHFKILLGDLDHGRIRQVERVGWSAETFWEKLDVNVNSAQYNGPYDMALFSERNDILVTGYGGLMLINKVAELSTNYKAEGVFYRKIVVMSESKIFVTTDSDGIHQFDDSLRLTKIVRPLMKLYLFDLENLRASNEDLSRNYLQEDIKLSANFGGIAALTEHIFLFTTVNEKSLYAYDIRANEGRKLVVAAPDTDTRFPTSFNYTSAGDYLTVVKTQLYIVGGTAETFKLNNFCDDMDENSTTKYPIYSVINLENGTCMMCDAIWSDTLQVGWVRKYIDNSSTESMAEKENPPSSTERIVSSTIYSYNLEKGLISAGVMIVVIVTMLGGLYKVRQKRRDQKISQFNREEEQLDNHSYSTVDDNQSDSYEIINLSRTLSQLGRRVVRQPSVTSQNASVVEILADESNIVYVTDPTTDTSSASSLESDHRAQRELRSIYVINPTFVRRRKSERRSEYV